VTPPVADPHKLRLRRRRQPHQRHIGRLHHHVLLQRRRRTDERRLHDVFLRPRRQPPDRRQLHLYLRLVRQSGIGHRGCHHHRLSDQRRRAPCQRDGRWYRHLIHLGCRSRPPEPAIRWHQRLSIGRLDPPGRNRREHNQRPAHRCPGLGPGADRLYRCRIGLGVIRGRRRRSQLQWLAWLPRLHRRPDRRIGSGLSQRPLT